MFDGVQFKVVEGSRAQGLATLSKFRLSFRDQVQDGVLVEMLRKDDRRAKRSYDVFAPETHRKTVARATVSEIGNSFRSEMLSAVSSKLRELTGNCERFMGGIRTIVSGVSSIGDVSRKISENGGLVKQLVLGVASLFLKFQQVCAGGMNLYLLLDAMVEMYRTFVVMQDLGTSFRAEFGLESLLALATMILPRELYEIVKRMQLFTNSKFLDDASGAFKLYSIVVDYLAALMGLLPFKVPDAVKAFVEDIGAFNHYGKLYQMGKLFKQWQDRPAMVVEASFRANFTDLLAHFESNLTAREWLRRSPGAQKKYEDYVRLRACILSYEQSSRIEPSCFVFEGPPGCMKTVNMTRLIDYLGRSKYCHITKSAQDGKDFFDTYNGEEIYYSDDVGIQGASQWRPIINMVSSTKTPLDVAAAHLKDTKYFTSPLIFLTTNCFSKLSGLTKADCIENVEALWRRGFVFDFAAVKREGGLTKGRVQFKYFTPGIGWRNELPAYVLEHRVRKYGAGVTILESSCESARWESLIAWMSEIVEDIEAIKSEQFKDNTLSSVDKDKVTFARQRMRRTNPAEVYIDAREEVESDSEFEGELGGSFVSKVVTTIIEAGAVSLEYCEYYFELVTERIASFTEWWNNETGWSLTTFCMAEAALLCYSVLVGYAVGTLARWFMDWKFGSGGWVAQCGVTEALKTVEKETDSKLHPSVKFLAQNVYGFDIQYTKDGQTCTEEGTCLMSGLHLITVGHACPVDEALLILYKSRMERHILIDHLPIKLVKRFEDADVGVWRLPSHYPSPFKSLASYFREPIGTPMNYLVTPIGVVNTLNYPAPGVLPGKFYYAQYGSKEITVPIAQDSFTYAFRGASLCGSVVVSREGKILGMHVAGETKGNRGVASRFTPELCQELKGLLEGSRVPVQIHCDMSPKVVPNFSGIKLANVERLSHSTPKESKIVMSPLAGVFPVSRVPAELSKYGPHTVKDVAKKSFKPLSSVPQDELDFGVSVLRVIVPEFKPIDMYEVIKGTEKLGGLNKKSSNGYGGKPSKHDCIDFELGELKPEFKIEYDEFVQRVRNGEVSLRDMVWTETLKDELRAPGKDPRSFRVSTLANQLLTKTLFGEMVEKIVTDRWFNQIMVGVNPFTEWEKMYKILDPHHKWAGDIASYDGNMLAQVQYAVFGVFEEKFTGETELLRFVCSCLAHCLVLVNDDLYLTTHSMPSGSFLTAILNSLVNRFYTAMWYCREMKKAGKKPSVSDFMDTVIDFVYGDDKVNAIKKKDRPFLNAITMRDFFISIGMDFTTSTKGVINVPYQSWEEITFLKRSFEFHPVIGRIVCPLDLQTVYSTMSFIGDSTNVDQIVQDKNANFQREIFLHQKTPFEGRDVEMLERACEDSGVPFVRLPLSYLRLLYCSEQYGDHIEELYGIKM